MIALALACTTPTPTAPPPPTDRDTDVPADTAVTDTAVSDTGTPPPPPEPPPGLQRWHTGDVADADVTPTGPGLILMGGGVEPDPAFEWWRGLLSGGDVVVLRTSGSDGYNDYLYADIGGVDSVETLLVDSRAFANDPYVAWRVQTAEGVFFAGGDQSTYVAQWSGTALNDAVHTAWSRGAVVGGTSAGLAILGDRVFSAENGTVYPHEALADPYNVYMTFTDDLLDFAPLAGWITDSHFAERSRMGRLLTFVARMQEDGFVSPARGIGVDERTALLVGPDGQGTVVGSGSVYIVEMETPAARCNPGQTLVASAALTKLSSGQSIALPTGATAVPSTTLEANDGVLSPADPY